MSQLRRPAIAGRARRCCSTWVLSLALALVGSIALEIVEVADVDPAATTGIVEHVRRALAEQSGCPVAVVDCRVTACAKPESALENPRSVVELALFGGVRRLTLRLERTGTPYRVEVLGPLDAGGWEARVRLPVQELSLSDLAERCTAPAATLGADAVTPRESGSSHVLAISATGLAVASLAASITFFALAGSSASELKLIPEYRPEVDALRDTTGARQTAGVVLLGVTVASALIGVLAEVLD